MKYIKSFEQFINEKKHFKVGEVGVSKSFIQLSEDTGDGPIHEKKSFDDIKSEYLNNPYGIGAQSIELIESPNGNILVFRFENAFDRTETEKKLKKMGIMAKKMTNSMQAKSFAYRYELNLFESEINESINSRVRAKIVVALKKAGFDQGDEYTYSTGTFLAQDMETAQDMADALAGEYRVAIYNKRVTKDGRVPMMIVEKLNEKVKTYNSHNAKWMKPEHRKVLDSIIQQAKGHEDKFQSGPEFFESGYTGVTFKIKGTKYYLFYSPGKVGLEDQSIGSITLTTALGAEPEWSVGSSYNSRNFGDVRVTKDEIKEAKKKFKAWIAKA